MLSQWASTIEHANELGDKMSLDTPESKSHFFFKKVIKLNIHRTTTFIYKPAIVNIGHL